MSTRGFPIIVGGKGGSGTRVFVSIVEKFGFFKGETNAFNDVIKFVPFVHKYYLPYLNEWWETGSIPEHLHVYMSKDFSILYDEYILNKDSSEECVFKNPQCMNLLPFYDLFFDKKCKFIHAVRDGRDMAVSTNLNEYKQAINFNIYKSCDGSVYEKNMNFWEISNLFVYNYGINCMKNRYLYIRYEDLIENPKEIIDKIGTFLESTMDSSEVEECISLVKNPKTIGRWERREKQFNFISIENKYTKGLKTFGYLK